MASIDLQMRESTGTARGVVKPVAGVDTALTINDGQYRTFVFPDRGPSGSVDFYIPINVANQAIGGAGQLKFLATNIRLRVYA